ncbi:MAG: penicillin-binding protein 2 [Candidatus Aminicenantes bacterium]|nr:MAG: penicillin-binding protein 2 [Candidatus Aminicenantes bacterium]
MKINSGERKRVFVIFIFFCLWVLLIGAWLVKNQVFDYGKNLAKVRAQSNRTFILHSKRGTIYDSSGEVLAISVKAKSAFLSSKDKADSLRLFNRILRSRIHLTANEKQDIKKRIKEGDKFIWIKRKLSDREYEILKKIKSPGKTQSSLDFIEEYKRIYPQAATACHILGGVGIDEQGLWGIEYSLNRTIRGKDCKVKVVQDARQKAFKLQYLTKPVDGKNIYLTIDSSIQFFVEKELEATIKKYKAQSGTVIVMDTRDGAILAMAGYPNFDPSDIKYTSPGVIKNKAISFLYHPGSTFKIILASTALEKNLCSPQHTFKCYNGIYKVKDREVIDDHPYNRLTFEEIIIYSSNIGAAKIGERLGRASYFGGIKSFGFGTRTGVRLPGEERGILNPLKKWTGVSVAFLAHGYEIAVTPIQMIRAFNVIASGGYLLEPYIVKGIDGVVLKRAGKKKILSPGTVLRMVAIMEEVVNRGTGKTTRIEGMTIAGKTGTTKKLEKSKAKIKYVSSFGGFFPSRHPRVTMFVIIDEPRDQYYGADVAAPLFKSIAERLLIYLKIFPELDKTNEIKL